MKLNFSRSIEECLSRKTGLLIQGRYLPLNVDMERVDSEGKGQNYENHNIKNQKEH